MLDAEKSMLEFRHQSTGAKHMNRKNAPYGTYRDYPKIHIYVSAYGSWSYVASTTWARTCKEARAIYADEKGLCLGNVKAVFAKN